MANMTQQQISELFNMPLPDVNIAIKKWGVQPVGTVRGRRKDLSLYDVQSAGEAVIQYYANSMNYHRRIVNERVKKIHDIRKVCEAYDGKDSAY